MKEAFFLLAKKQLSMKSTWQKSLGNKQSRKTLYVYAVVASEERAKKCLACIITPYE